MVYHYRKGLPESWYSLKMFWWLNLGVQVYSTVYGIYMDEYTAIQKTFGSIEIILAFVLIVLLLKTKNRSAERPRQN